MKNKILIACAALIFFQSNAVSQVDQVYENPNETLSYLVGTWRIDLKELTAFMDFEWGPNKTYILSKSRNIRNEVEAIENTALIAWDGVEGKFVISSVYNDPGGLLVGRGFMEINEGLISRDITLHYAEGQYAPFLKQTAGSEGLVMDYRQRWKEVDKDSFKGIMEVKVDGEWINPFKASGEEHWYRVKKKGF